MKKLNELIDCKYDTCIYGIKTDSREVKKGDLFVAIKGYFVDHSEYIDDAIKNGASAVITDTNYEGNIPIIKVDDIEKTLELVCKKFFGYEDDIKLFGITGTDGKTTTATILSEVLDNFENTAYIGTNGIKYNDISKNINNTTPKIEKIYEYLNYLKERKCQNCVLEVSSEALLHKRVDSLKFKYAIYTNITEDHLNIHKTVENYINSKKKLTTLLDDGGIIISNMDDLNQGSIRNNNSHLIYTYGMDNASDFLIKNIKEIDDRTYFDIVINDEVYSIKSPYLGKYNVYNLTAAFVVCYLEHFNLEQVINSIENLKPIPGRGEIFTSSTKCKIILDYAHTFNAIKNLVEQQKKYNQKIIVVTGAAGGREKEKRNLIGEYLLENCDLVIFTMDDPRYENVDDIIDDMIKTSEKTNYLRIIDRSKAIEKAISIAKENDRVLVIGKGRDNYMAIENRYENYSDYEVIKKYILD